MVCGNCYSKSTWYVIIVGTISTGCMVIIGTISTGCVVIIGTTSTRCVVIVGTDYRVYDNWLLHILPALYNVKIQ